MPPPAMQPIPKRERQKGGCSVIVLQWSTSPIHVRRGASAVRCDDSFHQEGRQMLNHDTSTWRDVSAETERETEKENYETDSTKAKKKTKKISKYLKWSNNSEEDL